MAKTIKVNDKLLLLLLAIAVLSEIFLLNQNFTLKKRISSYIRLEELLNESQAAIERSAFLNSLVGKCLPFRSETDLNEESNGLFEMKDSRFVVMFAFTIQDCASCLEGEIITWNSFYKKYDSKLCQVIGVTDRSGIENLNKMAESTGIQFPLIAVRDLNARLADYNITSTPVIFFGDGISKKIIYTYFPTPTNLSSYDFATKIQNIFHTCEK